MKCGFCGHEFDEGQAKKACGGCPGGCHSVHCPRCDYKNPLEPKLVGRLRGILTKREDRKRGKK